MTDGRCRNCHWWMLDKHASGWHILASEDTDWGYCLAASPMDRGADIEEHNAERRYAHATQFPVTSLRALAVDCNESIYGQLVTRGDFGCVLFKEAGSP